MKNLFRISGAILLILSISFIQSCKKEKPTPPNLTTIAATEISYTTATSGGTVTSDGGNPVTVYGICWSIAQNPTTSDSNTADGSGVGSFISNLKGLQSGPTYYVRAYATNSIGTSYGNQIFFTTKYSEFFYPLTGHIWMSDSLLTNGVDASGPDGMLRNFKGETKFNEDGTGYFGIYTGTWRFAYNETQIVITTESLPIPLTSKIAELTNISLKITSSLVMPPTVIKIRMTFKAK